jgi:hypothetical protein
VTRTWGTNQWTQVEVATAELIWSEPRVPGAPSRTAATRKNPSEEGKREARGLTRDQSPEEDLVVAVVICSSFSRRRLRSLSPSAPSHFAAVIFPFHDQKHVGSLVGQNTGGRGLAGWDVWGWAGNFPKYN